MMTKIREGYKETEIGVIPEDWDIDFLDNVAKRLTGHTPNKKIASYWGGEIPWVSLKDTFRLDKGYVYETTDYTTIDGINNSSAVLLPEGTVIISRDATVGKVGITSTKMATSQHFINYVCGNFLNNKYLYYTLINRKDEFVRIAIGSTIKTIGMPYFKALKVIVPPLPEQQRIAEILSTTDSHIEKLNKTIEDYQLLKKGMMKKLLTEGIGHTEFKETEIGRIPKEWEVKSLGELTTILSGAPFKSQFFNEEKNGLPLIRIRDILESAISTYYSGDFDSIYIVKMNDILIGMDGDFHVNKWKNIDALLNQRILKIETSIKSFDNEFLYYLVQPHIKNIHSTTPATTVKHLSVKDVKSLKIAVPSVKEQIEIASILNEIDRSIKLLSDEIKDFVELKKSLMERLLTGKVRTI